MKQIFFYSQKCDYCKEAYELLEKIGLNNFILICIEKENKIPPFIDRVPTLMLPPQTENTKPQILFESDLFTFLYNKLNIPPFMKNEMGDSISDNYSYINGDVELDHNFSFLNKNDETMITNPEEKSNNSISFDKLLESRTKDLDDILRTQNRGDVDFTKKII
jgi:hypothetical protein